MTDRTHELVLRIEKLERQNRGLKRWGGAALALTAVVGLSSMAAVVCKTVWAERFVLKDPNMRERAVITAYETGGAPKFSLLDHKGNPALTLGVNDDGQAYIELPGEEGLVRRPLVLPEDDQAEGLVH